MSEVQLKNRDVTMGKVSEVLKKCANFGNNFDWCNSNCDLCYICDGMSTVQDASKVQEPDLFGRFKRLLARLFTFRGGK